MIAPSKKIDGIHRRLGRWVLVATCAVAATSCVHFWDSAPPNEYVLHCEYTGWFCVEVDNPKGVSAPRAGRGFRLEIPESGLLTLNHGFEGKHSILERETFYCSDNQQRVEYPLDLDDEKEGVAIRRSIFSSRIQHDPASTNGNERKFICFFVGTQEQLEADAGAGPERILGM